MWPSIGTSQAPIAAALSLRKDVPVDQIEKIHVGLSAFGYDQQRDFLGEINTREHADHSVPYLVARAFLDGDVKVSDFEAPLPRPGGTGPGRQDRARRRRVAQRRGGNPRGEDGRHDARAARSAAPTCPTGRAACATRPTTPASRRSSSNNTEAVAGPRRRAPRRRDHPGGRPPPDPGSVAGGAGPPPGPGALTGFDGAFTWFCVGGAPPRRF